MPVGRRSRLSSSLVTATVAASLSASLACRGGGAGPSALDRLPPCTSDQGPTDALCGTLEVFENRQARHGRTLHLKIVVLPALSNQPKPDPIVLLAGGPGQGAATMAREVRDVFRRMQADRDIVLVDQRGTGGSNGLECEVEDDSLALVNEPEEAALQRLRTCLAGYDADVRLYTTNVAMDDLDDVRAHLGYERINVYGASYGTRAGLVYLRQYGSRVRSIVLDGAAPPDMRLPLYFARDAQRALDRLLADCAATPSCASMYPGLANRVAALFARLESSPPRVRLVHPRTGVEEEVRVDASLLANLVAGALYAPLTSSIVPELLVRAERDDFQGLLALGLANEGANDNMSAGMQLSVICAEDAPRIAAGDSERATAGSVFAGHLLTSRLEACQFWPRGEVPADYYDPVVSAVPALVLSGDLDPVTPPSWGESVAAHLANSRHIVAPATGHGVLGTGCGQRLVQAFFDRGSAEGLDTSCVDALKRPPFMLSPAGPDPGAGLVSTPP